MVEKSDSKNIDHLLMLWRLRCLRALKAHYDASTRQQRFDRILTIINVAAAIAVVSAGSAYWVISAKNEILNSFIAIVAVINVITSVIQYIFDYRARAYTHKRAASDYAILNRRIELMLVSEVSRKEMEEIRAELDGLGDSSPAVSEPIWKSAKEWTDRIDKLDREIFW
jgi:hypothetical protein